MCRCALRVEEAMDWGTRLDSLIDEKENTKLYFESGGVWLFLSLL